MSYRPHVYANLMRSSRFRHYLYKGIPAETFYHFINGHGFFPNIVSYCHFLGINLMSCNGQLISAESSINSPSTTARYSFLTDLFSNCMAMCEWTASLLIVNIIPLVSLSSL